MTSNEDDEKALLRLIADKTKENAPKKAEKPNKAEIKAKKKAKEAGPEIDMNDLSGFNTERKALIKDDDFSKLFVAEDSNAVMK